jgi:vancomycin resistance protein YoaR
MKSLIKATFALLALAVVGGTLGAAHRVGVFQELPPGVRVDGRVIASDQPLGVWLDEHRKALLTREVIVSDGEGYARVPLGELGVELDVGAMMRVVRSRAEAPPGQIFNVLLAAREGEIDVPLEFRVDHAKAEMYLAKLAPSVQKAPINARLDLMSHERINDVPGAELDVEATISRLEGLPHNEGDVLSLATRPVKAPFTSADIANVDVSKVLSAWETNFTLWGVGAARAVNIATAAKHIDGWVVAPGETFSFNQVVGPRTLEAGFAHAPEIVGDELEMGVGGGACQVASTMYAAALHGALEIVERHNHGRPSSYTKLGLDATVAYGKVDLQFRNTLPFPVILHAFLPKPTTVRVEILGADPVAKVTYVYAINKSDDFFRRLTYKPSVPAGKMHLHQKGMRGHEVISRVVTTWPDGRVTERSYFSGYRPVPEVFWVGRDFDEGQLPELPDGAARIERKGVPAPTPSTQPASDPAQGNG